MHQPQDQLRAVAADRYADGWRMPTGVAEREHVLAGQPYTSSVWDLLEVSVRWDTVQSYWHVAAHRWTTDSGWDGRKFFTFPPDRFHGSAAAALEVADRTLVELLDQHAAGTLQVADKG